MNQKCIQFVTICTILTSTILVAYCVPITGVMYYPDCMGDGNYNFEVGFYPFPDGEIYAKGTVHDVHAGAMDDRDWAQNYVNGVMVSQQWVPDLEQMPTWVSTGGASIYYVDQYNLVFTLPNYPSWVNLSMTVDDLPLEIPIGSEGNRNDPPHTHLVKVASVGYGSFLVKYGDNQQKSGGPTTLASTTYQYPQFPQQAGYQGSYTTRAFTNNRTDQNSCNGWYKNSEVITTLLPAGIDIDKVLGLYEYYQFMDGTVDSYLRSGGYLQTTYAPNTGDGPGDIAISIPWLRNGSQVCVSFLDAPGQGTDGPDIPDDKNRDGISTYNRIDWNINFRVDFYFDRILLGSLNWGRRLDLRPYDPTLPISQQEWNAVTNQ